MRSPLLLFNFTLKRPASGVRPVRAATTSCEAESLGQDEGGDVEAKAAAEEEGRCVDMCLIFVCVSTMRRVFYPYFSDSFAQRISGFIGRGPTTALWPPRVIWG